jgi:hypothetical protein
MTQPRFEIGLVMAGAVSAGAYSAGVLDFLVEAMDAWERAKREAPAEAPPHRAALKVVTGASAGSIASAILAACLKHDFPHVTLDNHGETGQRNPLYDSWVNRIDIAPLLGTRDVAGGGKALSALDSTILMEIAQRAIDYGQDVAAIDRPWLCDPLRFIFTLTNLRGVPYHYALGGSRTLGMDMTRHGECMRFALSGLGEIGASARRANEYPLAYPAPGTAKWPTWGSPFALASVASGAFPIGLSPRALTRNTSDYDGEPVVVPAGADQPAEVRRISPTWTAGINPDPGASYGFVCVDGGAITNEPVDLARIELLDGDPLGRNERDGTKASRAVLMIDPFTGADKPGPAALAETDLLNSAFSLLGSLKDQARYNPADIALAADESIYSRFLISPVRPGAAAGNSAFSIACGSLGGFGGFLSRAYREHDYFLGRRNCQRFLQQHFTLPPENPLFAGWTQAMRDRFRVPAAGGAGYELPIIPLMPAVHPGNYEQQAAPWPLDRIDPDDLSDPVSGRLDALYDSFVTGFRGFFLGIGWSVYLKPKLRELVIGKIRSGLEEHGLLTRS